MRRTSSKRRGGYVMVLLAMLLFGLMAMAALVIDMGFARLTQRQLQTAANTAALEGLRGEGSSSLTYEHEQRQEAAERLIEWTFDDDLDSSNGDDGIAGSGGRFGAGPLVSFSGGAGDPSLAASQLMTVDPNNPTYKPVLQRGVETPESFRVNLQRGGTQDGSADVYSQGQAVSFLFARGSLMNRALIQNGITVRGESIAEGIPALSVGLPVTDTSGTEVYPGAIAIGYQLADWNGSRSDPRQVDTAKTVVGQVVSDLGTATLADGYCCIYDTISGADRVVGFGMIEAGAPLPRFVAITNTSGRLSDVWADLDPAIRDLVRAGNESIVGGLLVAVPRRVN
ncbi:MAG: pilus assembly protein TadG-related protein [Rubripirellula sp.]